MALSLNILIVEPSTDLRVGLRNRLEDMEQNVQSAASSAEALALVEWHGMPDLILVSTQLAPRSGNHFLEALRDLPFYNWVPAFQLLAPGEEALSGVAGFLELPVSTQKLEALLNFVETPEGSLVRRDRKQQPPVDFSLRRC